MNHASRDLNNMLTASFVTNLTNQTDNTALTGTITKDGSELVAFLLCFGTVADADATFALTLTESDDNVTYTTVAAKDYGGSLTGLTFASDNVIRMIAYWGSKKYVKLTATPTGNSGSLDWWIIKLMGNSRVQP